MGRFGKKVAEWPVVAMVIVFVIVAASAPGIFVSLNPENRDFELWIASGNYNLNLAYLSHLSDQQYRFSSYRLIIYKCQ